MTASALLSKKYLRTVFAALAAAVLCGLSYFRVFEIYELQTYDFRCRLRGPRPVSKDIMLVDIADDTLAAIGAWPFSRDYHAALIDVLKAHGARAVIFDILFVEPHPAEDEAVAQSARAAGNVYFVYAFTDPRPLRTGFEAADILAPLIAPYEKSAKRTGFINVVADVDGKRRRVVPVIRHDGKDFYHVSLEAAMDVLGADRQKVFVDKGRHLHLGDERRVPLDETGALPINYAGLWKDTFEHVSYYYLLYSQRQLDDGERPLVDLAKLRGKICVVGHTATATHDANATPLEPIYPNVGIHANVLNSLLNGDFITRAGRLWNLWLILILNVWVACTAFNKRLFVSFLRALLILVLFVVAAVCLFIRWGLWVDLFLPVSSAVVIYASATFTRVIQEMRRRETIEKELRIASQIQKSFLPEKAPAEAGIGIAVYMKSAKEVGGDLYAFLKPGDQKIGVMIGDVSGKGTPAALFMAKVVSEFKFSAREKADPDGVLLSLNESVASESTGGLFVTMTYAVFDVHNRKVVLSNGGHLPVVYVDKEGRAELLSIEDGMPIGVLPGVSFASLERTFREGDVFAFYSDGVSEARNKKKEEYTVERLQALLCRFRVLSAKELVEKTVTDLNKFMGKADQHDDITLIVVKIGSV